MICRLCLNSANDTIQIFEGVGLTLNVAAVLAKYFWFQVSISIQIFVFILICICFSPKAMIPYRLKYAWPVGHVSVNSMSST